MGASRKIGRREFTTKSALALLAGTTITITACESDSPTAPSDPGVSTTISANHGHDVALSVDQLSASTLALDIQGSSTHPHTVVLSMADLQAIAAGTRVTVESSSDDGHTHSVAFELT